MASQTGSGPNNSMWKSKQEAKWGHSESGLKALGGKDAVSEWDAATPKGSLPAKKPSLRKAAKKALGK